MNSFVIKQLLRPREREGGERGRETERRRDKEREKERRGKERERAFAAEGHVRRGWRKQPMRRQSVDQREKETSAGHMSSPDERIGI